MILGMSSQALAPPVDFFISHHGEKGARHAAEIREYLSGAGFHVVSQNPDIAIGDNFLARMHKFIIHARDLIVILTADYTDSYFTVLEFTSFMAGVAQSALPRRLLVFRVEDCNPPGLLAPFRYADLAGITDSDARREIVVAAAKDGVSVNFTAARRAIQTALRQTLVSNVPNEASQIEALLGSAATDRLHALDSHASGMTTDFGASIREFFALYAGADGKPDTFGGRAREFLELTAWLKAETVPPYRLLVGSAGRGKSMLLVRWAIDIVSNEDLDVVFIPISIRCQTNTASAVLQALATRLAHLYEEEAPALGGASPEVLCNMVRGYLSKERRDNRRTLVILDGLDEAVDKEVFRGLLPTDVPPSLRVLLAARPQVGLGGDDDEWRSQLGFGMLAAPSRRKF